MPGVKPHGAIRLNYARRTAAGPLQDPREFSGSGGSAIDKGFHLIRNEKLFQLYAVKDGQAFEPDFVLPPRRAGNGKTAIMQLFIEPKGEHPNMHDRWKEDFLEDIAARARLETVFQGRDCTVYGLAFFNKGGILGFKA